MKNYIYQNTLINKKELKKLLAWCFTNYGAVQASLLADELKSLGFRFATQAGISISIEDLKIPPIKFSILQKTENEIEIADNSCLEGKTTEVERFQKVIATWNITSESLKDEVVSYFKTYDPLNSVYIMAFSGARGNLSQVRQLVGMRGLMSDPSGEIIDLPIKKNFREGLTITDYLMSGYGARKGIVDTALKTANSGYLTRRLIDVAHDILIREKDCFTPHSILFQYDPTTNSSLNIFYERLLGRLLNKSVYNLQTNELIAEINQQITPTLIQTFKQKNITTLLIRSPLTCQLNRSICQKCYGWNLASENLVDLGEAIGIIAGQSIGEPGTQLTMRTFHTGGIFTADASQQILSPIDGVLKFSESLKTYSLRTNTGENVLVTENSGLVFIFSSENQDERTPIQVDANTFLYKAENQYIQKNDLIGQSLTTSKQTKFETKNILTSFSGEICLLTQESSTNIDKLAWLLAGQLYNVPINAFFNLYNDSIINKNSFIFRTKLINQRTGFIKLLKNSIDLSQQIIEIVSHFLNCQDSKIKKLETPIDNFNYLLNLNAHNYLICLENTYSNLIEQNCAKLITNKFLTQTGGIAYLPTKSNGEYKQTILWLSEETYFLNRDRRLLLVEENEFIGENFEIVPNVFAKTSGRVEIVEKNNIIKEITIKSGRRKLLDIQKNNRSKRLQEIHQQVFYPGETILNKIKILQPSFCELKEVFTSPYLHLLIRPLTLYEMPLTKSLKKTFGTHFPKDSLFKIKNQIKTNYVIGEQIKTFKNINLINQSLNLSLLNSVKQNEKTEISLICNRQNKNCLQIIVSEKFYISHYIPNNLKYLKIQLALIVENNQFLNSYTTFGYLEVLTEKSLKIRQLKSQQQQTSKQILLISSNDCLEINKSQWNLTKMIPHSSFFPTGKLLVETNDYLIIQKGRPYFFPNCQLSEQQLKDAQNFENDQTKSLFSKNQLVVNYKKNSIRSLKQLNKILTKSIDYKIVYSRNKIIKGAKNSSKQIQQNTKTISNLPAAITLGMNLNRKCLLKAKQSYKFQNAKKEFNLSPYFLNQFYLTQNFYKIENLGTNIQLKSNKVLLTKSEQLAKGQTEVNMLYCRSGQFMQSGEILGLLTFEKEITGDIVQGLPRIEQLLEARKIENNYKQMLTTFKVNPEKLIIMVNSRLDPHFNFYKLGTSIANEDKINPHVLLKLYFKYYRKKKAKVFTAKIKYQPILNLYDATYRSFKKVQDLILNSVQVVYKSQGVTIADKHLEIIIKQMTSKVKIFEEGNTPLLPLEIIDLHQINYINQIILKNNLKQNLEKNIATKNQPALYCPILFGITKAALNSPSFISAASFQDTTRVLTKAAIEGQIDWLRGLKENVIIGHLIPAGTGYTKFSKIF